MVIMSLGVFGLILAIGLLTNPVTAPIGIAILIGLFILIGIPLLGITWFLVTNGTLIAVIVGVILVLYLIMKVFK